MLATHRQPTLARCGGSGERIPCSVTLINNKITKLIFYWWRHFWVNNRESRAGGPARLLWADGLTVISPVNHLILRVQISDRAPAGGQAGLSKPRYSQQDGCKYLQSTSITGTLSYFSNKMVILPGQILLHTSKNAV